MKVMITGGGSGGHIMPLLAVASELKRKDPSTTVIYVGQQGDALADVPAANPNVDEAYTVRAGKLRRYADEGWRQLLDYKTQFLNIRDVLRTIGGIWQSYWLLRRLRPDVVFTRGGFVSVPVAYGAYLNGIPYITHDSDSVPSLANRLIARSARLHAVALPAELYPYPAQKTVMVGIPVAADYQYVTPDLQRMYRRQLGLKDDVPVLLLTGGGNGARALNHALIANTRYLLSAVPGLIIIHIAGRALEDETNAAYDALALGPARGRVHVYGFVQNLYCFSGTADVVVARGSATNLAEFAVQGRACVLVPSKQLSWNIKNAAALSDAGAVLQLTEDQAEQPERLGRTITGLLTDTVEQQRLARALRAYARPHAASQLADLLLQLAGEV